jgi:hypothetical protein
LENKEVHPTGAAFSVVGIGASAGGLLALEPFLSHVPFNSGMASDGTLGLRTTRDRQQAVLEKARSLGLDDGLS